MKKLLSISVLVVMLFTTNFLVSAQNSESMDIRDRLGKPTLNILDRSHIEFKDSEGNVIEKPSLDSKLNVRFDWSILDEDASLIKGGDTFTFDLPFEFRINNKMTGTLDEFGSYEIGTDGKVTIIFDDEVANNSDVSGFISFTARLNEKLITNPGDYVIELPVNEDSEFTFDVRPKDRNIAIEKSGVAQKKVDLESKHSEANANFALWSVIFNKANESLTNVSVEDKLPEGLTLKDIKVYPLEVDLHGNIVKRKEALSSDLFTVNDTTVSFKEIKEAYEIVYITEINESMKPEEGGKITFENNAYLNSNEVKDLDTKSTLLVNYHDILNKTVAKYDAEKQIITWKVEYNFRENTYHNPLIEDMFSSDLSYVKDSISIKTKNGKDAALDFTVLNNPHNQIKLQFNETVDQPLVITYQTKVRDGVIVEQDKEYKNSVKTRGIEKEASVTVRPQFINKFSHGIDYENKKITWGIELNKNEYRLKDLVVNDIFVNKGLVLNESNFRVTDMTQNKELTKDDYQLVPTFDGDEMTGFGISFMGDYADMSSKLRITLETDYDVNKLNPANANEFINKAEFSGKALNKDGTVNKEVSGTSIAKQPINTSTLNNGHKSGNYNAIDKEITWSVAVNYNSEKLKSAKLEDIIQEGQNFVKDSLVIQTYTVQANGSVVLKEDNVDLSNFQIEYPSEKNNQKLTVHFPQDENTKYYITFKTSVAGEKIDPSYNNTATFINDNFVTRDLKATVSIRNGGKFVSKNGSQDGDKINWRIAINQSQSTVRNAMIKDNPSGNQILLLDTFKLYPVKMKANGEYTIDYENALILNEDYNIDVITSDSGKESFTIHFLETIENTYVFEYTSQISASADDLKISNTVNFMGTEIQEVDNTDSNSEMVIDIDSAGGGAVGSKGSFSIIKVGEQNQPLAGVKFELYNKKNVKIATKVTDENGKIDFINLVYGDYTLKEVETLTGYVIDSKLVEGITITVNDKSAKSENALTLVNKKNKVTINKVDVNSQQIKGAIFKLEKMNDRGNYTVVEDKIIVSEGQIVLEGLAVGSYRLQEMQAPNGYVLNTEAMYFEVKADVNGQAQDAELNFVNYQGSVILTKVDETGQVLKGVVFELYDENHNLIEDNLVTDENGMLKLLNQLVPNTYYFKEVSSVNGNIVNELPLQFTIAGAYEGKPTAVEVFATNSKAHVTFNKVNQNGTPLENVEFKLYKKGEQNSIATVFTNKMGTITVDQLTPGDYYFEEVTPLVGYIRNTEVLEFNIPEKAEFEKVELELGSYINYQGSINVVKTDMNGNQLKEAEFVLKKATGEYLNHYETVDGNFAVDGLEPGSYVLQETKAPKGYILDTKEISFEIPDEYQGAFEPLNINVINVKDDIKVGLPGTGLSNNTIYLAAALIFMGVLAVVYNKKTH